VLLGCAIIAATAIASPWIVKLYHSIMSRLPDAAAAADRADTVVYRPVESTSLDDQTREAAASGMNDVAADIDAGNWPRFLTDDELVVFLASQRLRNGKYRSSANKIVAYMGGDRNHVLALVRQVREGAPAEFRPLTPEQRALREELRLQPNGHE